MKFFLRRYGAHPLHLFAMVASFALAGYAAWTMIQFRPIAVIVWFVGAAVGHDLVLLPLYALADGGLQRLRPRRATDPEAAGRTPSRSWLNYVRVPAAVSLLLLLIYAPSIARLSSGFSATTELSSAGYFTRWLAVTGALFLLAGVLYALHLGRVRRRRAATPPGEPAAPTEVA